MTRHAPSLNPQLPSRLLLDIERDCLQERAAHYAARYGHSDQATVSATQTSDASPVPTSKPECPRCGQELPGYCTDPVCPQDDFLQS